MGRRRSKVDRRRIALERIERLLELAKQATLEDRLADAKRYGELAWRLKTRYRVPSVPELKARVCRRCRAYLLPGRTSRTRMTGSKVSTTCLDCGHVRRVPMIDEQKARRRSDRDAEPDPGPNPGGDPAPGERSEPVRSS